MLYHPSSLHVQMVTGGAWTAIPSHWAHFNGTSPVCLPGGELGQLGWWGFLPSGISGRNTTPQFLTSAEKGGEGLERGKHDGLYHHECIEALHFLEW